MNSSAQTYLKKALFIALILLIAVPLIFILEAFAQYGIAALLPFQSLSEEFRTIINLSIALIVSGAIIALYLKFLHKNSFRNIGLSTKGRAFDFFFGFAMGIVLISIGFLILVINRNLEISNISFNIKHFILGFVIMILVALHEEIIIRGYLLNVLNSLSTKIAALIISSVYFASLHIFNNNIGPLALTNIFLAGVLLGVPYIFTKNLWFPIAFHLSWNFFQGPVLGFNVSGNSNNSIITHKIAGNEIITGGEFGLEGSVITTVLLAVAIAALYAYYQKASNLRKKVKIDFTDNQLYIKEDSDK